MTEIEKIFMERDGMTAEEAKNQLNELRQQVIDGEDPEEVLYDVDLEPDYIFDIL